MFSMLSTPRWPYTKKQIGRDSDHAEGAECLQSPDETLQDALTLLREVAGDHIYKAHQDEKNVL